ncbi:MAG TPA: ABC transporter permease [Rhodocyclaceae bacterium]|nr:ABC transporter permease [Rhodocyclaceae bacterium]
MEKVKSMSQAVLVPFAAICIFLALWSYGASRVNTSLGAVPGPSMVFTQAKVLIGEHFAERQRQADFYKQQDEDNKKKLAEDPHAETQHFKWTGPATYIDQIFTSLKTVFTGFLLATLVAVPIGILCGLSKAVQTALNPIIQVFKPVSPLAWLPIVTLVVSAVYVTSDGAMFQKSFLISAITVTLCSLWPTLINTAIGVNSVDKDLLNVARALQLPALTKVRKIIVPSALPFIFTGMRLSLSVGWMVLIAAEMLAQNPGLGKFVWDEFQNGSADSLGRIMVAVLTIGIIGFLLDRIMLALQQLASRR